MSFLKQKLSTQSQKVEKTVSEEFDIVGATYYAVAPAGYSYSTIQTEYYGARKYNTLFAAEAGLPASPSTPMVINIIGDWTSATDTTAVTFAGTTSTATNYILVRALGEARHQGDWDTTKYNLAVTATNAITLQTNSYYKFQGLQFSITTAQDWTNREMISGGAGDIEVTIDSCVMRSDTSTDSGHWIIGLSLQSEGTQKDWLVTNTLFVTNVESGGNTNAAVVANELVGSDPLRIYNCTFKTWGLGVLNLGAISVYVGNCGFNGSAEPIADVTLETTNSTTTPSLKAGSDTFLDYNDSTWRNNGTDFSAYLTKDIIGRTRKSWDIGASVAPPYNHEEFDVVGATYYAVAEAGYEYSEEQTAFYDTRKYNTLSAAEAALPASPTTPMIINILGTWINAETTFVEFNGSSTSETNYILVRAIGEARHDGKWNTSAYRIEIARGNDAGNIGVYTSYTYLDGLQTWVNQDGPDYCGIRLHGGIQEVRNCIIRGTSGSSSYTGGILLNSQSAGTINIFNTLIYGFSGSSSDYGIMQWGTGQNANISNCTVVDCYFGIYRNNTSGILIIKNNLVMSATNGFAGDYDTGSDYNASDLTSDAPGSNSVNDFDATFVDATNKDYRLSAADSKVFSGANLEYDSDGPVKTDIRGVKRKTWSIGAFEYVRNESFDHYVQLNGTSEYLTALDSPANSVTGSIDIRIKIAADDWTPGTPMTPIAKWSSASTISYLVSISGGNVQLWFSQNGTSSDNIGWTTGYTDGTTHWLRFVYNVSTTTAYIYDSEDYNPVDESGTWNQRATDSTPTYTAIHDNASPVEIGSYLNGTSEFFGGKVFYAEVRDGIDGTIVAKFNAADVDDSHTYFANIDTEDKWTNNGATYVPGDFDAESQDYFDRQETAGGSLSTNTKTAIDTFIKNAKTKKYWAKLKRVNLMCGDFAGLFVPLKNTLGGTTETNSGFVTGDYDEENGLAGDGSSYIDTGVAVNDLTVGNLHVSFIGVGFVNSDGNDSSLISAHGPATAYSGFDLNDWIDTVDKRRFYCDNDADSGGLIESESSAAGQPTQGFLCGNQQNTSSTKLYYNGFLINEDTQTISTWSNSDNVYVMAASSDGATIRQTNAICRGYTIGEALTDAEVIMLNEDLNEFNTAIGRGIETVPTTNLQAHYAADFGVFSDAGSTLAVADDQVYQWNDKSGNGNHVTQTTAGDRPLYRLNAQNGLPGVEFVSSDYLNLGSALLTAAPITVYVVYESSNDTSEQTLLQFVDTSVFDNYFDFLLYGDNDDKLWWSARSGDGADSKSAITYNINKPQIGIGQEVSSSLRYVWLDGGNSGSNTDSKTPTGIDDFSIGYTIDSTPGFGMIGYIYEVLVYNVAHDAATRAKIHEYLKNKWL